MEGGSMKAMTWLEPNFYSLSWVSNHEVNPMIRFSMKNYHSVIIGLGLMIISQFSHGCGSSSSNKVVTGKEQEAPPPPPEDDLLLRLSAEMTTDTSLAGRDRNAIIDHAIEGLVNIYPTNSGLFYEILAEGEGEKIAWGDYLSVHYQGKFLKGGEFANSRRRNRPLEFYVGNMIDAWNEGMQLIAPGGHIRLFVPSHLGYGEEGLKDKNDEFLVPPNSILVFDVEVLERSKEE